MVFVAIRRSFARYETIYGLILGLVIILATVLAVSTLRGIWSAPDYPVLPPNPDAIIVLNAAPSDHVLAQIGQTVGLRYGFDLPKALFAVHAKQHPVVIALWLASQSRVARVLALVPQEVPIALIDETMMRVAGTLNPAARVGALPDGTIAQEQILALERFRIINDAGGIRVLVDDQHQRLMGERDVDGYRIIGWPLEAIQDSVAIAGSVNGGMAIAPFFSACSAHALGLLWLSTPTKDTLDDRASIFTQHASNTFELTISGVRPCVAGTWWQQLTKRF